MPFDPATLHQLEYQGRRMRAALHGTLPPDRKEAKAIQKRVDDILDRRPDVYAVAPDGEVIWDNASPMVLDQVSPSVVHNDTDIPEYVFPPSHGGYPEDPPTGGGVGLLDRP